MTAVIPKGRAVLLGSGWRPAGVQQGDLIEGEAIPVELPAGSVLWFHRDLVHGSQSNRSDTNRRVLVTAYQPAGLKRWRLDKTRPIRGA
jgi:ectoine hydroxylase-related dioxygenase (phytanoyl-CoA dioxygenase family)